MQQSTPKQQGCKVKYLSVDKPRDKHGTIHITVPNMAVTSRHTGTSIPRRFKYRFVEQPAPVHDGNRLVGLVVKAPASRAEDPGFESRLRRDFFPGSSHISDLKIGTPVGTLPGVWQYRDWWARCQYTVTG